ncbi:MAG: four helix bundle protein [Caldithrix sp.]|nr:MAG: four helix bundle protein [Caldithrix sp.]
MRFQFLRILRKVRPGAPHLRRRYFFKIARSSLVEIDTQLEIANRLNFCAEEALILLGENLNHIFASLSKLIQKTGEKNSVLCLALAFINK